MKGEFQLVARFRIVAMDDEDLALRFRGYNGFGYREQRRSRQYPLQCCSCFRLTLKLECLRGGPPIEYAAILRPKTMLSSSYLIPRTNDSSVGHGGLQFLQRSLKFGRWHTS